MNQAAGIDAVEGGRAYIPWDAARVDAADAKLQAQQLAEAEKSGDLAQIKAIELDLRDHSSDKEWLADFWSQPGTAASAAGLAAVLRKTNGSGTVPLTAADQKILGTYASSLAAACRLGGLAGDQGQQLVTDFSDAAGGDPWSAAMLLKAGPAGSSYGAGANGTGANLLARVTEQTLTAYANGSLNMPIDLRAATQDGSEPSATQITAVVTANDPLAAMLVLDAQNKTAAQEVMAGYNPVTGKISQPESEAWARLLLTKANTNNTIYTPVYPKGPGPAYMKIMLSDGPPGPTLDDGQTGPEWDTYGIPDGVLGGFLDAATSGPRGKDNLSNAEFSAYAAASIIVSTPPAEGNNGIYLPQPLRQALANTFMRYMPDIAASVGDEDNAQQPPQITNQIILQNGREIAGYWNINISTNALSDYLEQVSADPVTYGNLEGAVASKMGVALGMKLKGISDGTNDNPFGDLASLYGRLMNEQTTNQYLIGREEDAENAMLNAMIDFAKDHVDMIPVAGDAAGKLISYDETLAIIGFPQIPEFGTDNASNAVREGKRNFSEAQLKVMIPIVQGLVQTGEITPQSSWYQDGKVIPNQHFYNWWRWQKGLELTDYSSPDRDESGKVIAYSSKELDEWMLEASQWMGLGGAGFGINFSSGGG